MRTFFIKLGFYLLETIKIFSTYTAKALDWIGSKIDRLQDKLLEYL